MKSKSLIILIAVSFWVSGLSAQKISFELIDGDEIGIPSEYSPVYTLFHNKLYFTRNSFGYAVDKSDTTIVADVCAKSPGKKVTDTVSLRFPKNVDLRYDIDDIAVNAEHYVVLSKLIYIFNNKGDYISSMPSYKADRIFITADNKLLIYKNYNSHPKDDSVTTKLIQVDLKDNKVIASYFPPFSFIGYTHFAGAYVAASDKSLLFSQTIPYNIVEYNQKLQPIDSIQGALNNTSQTLEKLKNAHQRMAKDRAIKNFMSSIGNIDSVERIQKIYLLANDTLLVVKTVAGFKNEYRNLDVWVRSGKGRWKIFIKNQLYQIKRPEGNETITKNNIPLYLFISAPILFTTNNEIYFLEKHIPPQIGIRGADYQASQDAYYENHELYNSIWRYKWKIVK